MRNFRSWISHLGHGKFPVVDFPPGTWEISGRGFPTWDMGSNIGENKATGRATVHQIIQKGAAPCVHIGLQGAYKMEVLWCTIKEYRRISVWAKEISARRIRQMIQTGIFPEEVRRMTIGKTGAKYTYQIKLTNPEEVNKLSRMRCVDATIPTDTNSQVLTDPDSRKPTLFSLDMTIPVGSFLDIAMQNKLIRREYQTYLSNHAKRKPEESGDHLRTSKNLKNRYIVRCNRNMGNSLYEYSKQTGLTMKESYVVLLMEYLNSPAGHTAMRIAQVIEDKHYPKAKEKEDSKYGYVVCGNGQAQTQPGQHVRSPSA